MSATFKVTVAGRDRRRLPDREGGVDEPATAGRQSETTTARVRNVLPIKINEVRLGTGANPTNQFIELYNASAGAVDLSNWTLINTPSQWAPVKLATIPAGTKLAARRLLPARPLQLGAGGPRASRRDHHQRQEHDRLGSRPDRSTSTARRAQSSASGRRPTAMTTVFIPVSTGPWITIPAGSTNLPVTNAAGFAVGEKIGIDIGGNYELATVTAVGKAATQTTLSAAAAAGATNIKVAANANMTVGDTLTVGTGGRKELVKVASVGTRRERHGRRARCRRSIRSRSGVDVSDVGTGISFSPATKFPHVSGDAVQALGSGITLDQPAGQRATRTARPWSMRWPATAATRGPGAEPVVRRHPLRQGRLDRTARRQRRGGRRRHRLRIAAEQLERETAPSPAPRSPRSRPIRARAAASPWCRRPAAADRVPPAPRSIGAWAASRTGSTPTASAPIS